MISDNALDDAEMGFSPEARWIWDGGGSRPRNAWLLFRLDFEASAAELEGARLRLCVDTRYEAWLNGTRLGSGPIRSWPDLLYPDTYGLGGVAREGGNRLEVLVNHYGLGTCSSIVGAAGLIAELVLGAGSARPRRLASDASWRVAAHPGYVRTVPKMANGLSWSEVYLADEADDPGAWAWSAAVECEGAEYRERRFATRDIEYLGDEPAYPAAVLSRRLVRRRGFIRSVNLRWLAFPGELDLNKHKVFRGFLGFSLLADRACLARLAVANDPHDSKPLRLRLNGRERELANGRFEELALDPGSNWVLVDVSGMFHDPEFHLVFDLPGGCRLAPLFDALPETEPGGPGELCFLGPFGSLSMIQAGEPLRLELPPDPVYEALRGARSAEQLAPFAARARALGPDCVSPHHVALDSLYQLPLEELPVGRELQRLCRPAAEDRAGEGAWIGTEGGDVELVLDFGRELTGYLELELEASAGTVLDFFCYESQHDGIIEHTFSLNNGLRYRCAEGRQRYRSPVRRGFRYCMLTIRGGGAAVRLHRVFLHFSSYPVAAAGRFRSSDALLDRIWELCRHTLRLCMEDTFVDCPAYEQAFWTGDSYTSSLYSHYLFGCYEFPAHGNRLAARSLARSPLVESTVPSAWQNVIPNWSFLWVQSCVDHLWHSGDEATFGELFPALMQTLRNALRFVPREGPLRGLFSIDAWNFIDWAPLDSPESGAVAHQNAILAWTMGRLAEAARITGRQAEARELEEGAATLRRAIDEAFWSEERRAYVDCIRPDGSRSKAFSLHAQLFMYLAGCGSAERRAILAGYLLELPEGFTDIASPFVRLFHYQALLGMEGRDCAGQVFAAIRGVWGEMLRRGATTCWEGWSFIPGHYTRSHCHAWSSSPAYFLGAHLAGVRPLEPGFKTTLVQPRFDSLTWLEAAVPTPAGPIVLRAESRDGGWDLGIEAPASLSLLFRAPPGYRLIGEEEGRVLPPREAGGLVHRYSLRLERSL